MRKILAITMALCLAVLSGCVQSPTIATVNGSRIDGSEFAYYLNYQLLSGGVAENPSKEQEQLVKDEALNQAILNEIVVQKSKELGLTISKEDLGYIKDLKTDFVKELGGSANYLAFLKQSALTDRTYEKSQKNSYYHNMLLAHLVENPTSPTYIGFTDESIRKYFSDNYLKVKYVFIKGTDDNGGTLGGDDLLEAEKFATIIASGSNEAGKDFDVVIEKYNQDSEMQANPEGFTFSKAEVAKHPVYKGVLELEENQVGGVVKTGDGFYILKRCPVDAGYFDANREKILNQAIDERFAEVLDKWRSEAKVTIGDAYAQVDTKNYLSFVK